MSKFIGTPIPYKPKSPKWRKFTRKELRTNPITLKPLFGKQYTLHQVGEKIIDGYRNSLT